MQGIKSAKIVLPDGIHSGTVLFEQGTIRDIITDNRSLPSHDIEDIGSDTLMAGLVDTHVHINEPGRTDWEGFETATHAAAAGGITTVIDMPLNCIPVTTTHSALKIKQAAVEGKLWVDTGFHGGIVPGNELEVKKMIDSGVKSFKAFLVDSGIDEFPKSTISTLEKSMPILAKYNIPLLVHAELASDLSPTPQTQSCSEENSYTQYLNSRPPSWENAAIEMMIELAERFNCPIHIVHLSSAGALNIIGQARARGIRISVETCPHYLTISSEQIPEHDPRFKCAPPIREEANRLALWEGIRSKNIDFIVSDHSPCHPKLKLLDQGNIIDAWGGISSLQFGLPLIWSELRDQDNSLTILSEMMCENPANLVGLEQKKGRIAQGCDADFVIWNPDRNFEIEKNRIFHRHKTTPYEGREVFGYVKSTYLRGQKIFDDGCFIGKPQGTMI